jgi:hypothetical protein
MGMSRGTRKVIVIGGFFVIGLVFTLAWIFTCMEFYRRGTLDELGIAVALTILFCGLFGLRRGFLAALPEERDAEF